MRRITKKVMTLVVMMCLVATSLVGCGESGNSDTINIGAVVPLTGDVPVLGESAKNGYQLAVDIVNEEGGVLGKQINLIIEDDENQASKAPTVAQKLIAQDEVIGILGAKNSKCSIPMGPICTSNNIPMVTPTSTNQKVTEEGGEYVYRACFIDPFQGQALAKFAKNDLSATTASIIYDISDDYSMGLAEAFKEAFVAQGGEIISEETYSSGQSDFNAQLTNIKDSNPDILFMPGFYSYVGLIAKQAKALGIEATFLGGDGWDSADLVEIGGTAMEDSYYSVFYASDDTAQAVVDFKEAYMSKYGSEPDGYAALSYDAAMVMINAVKNAGSTDPEAIREALQNTDLDVVSGHIKYDENRNPIKSAVICTVKDGAATYYTTVQPE